MAVQAATRPTPILDYGVSTQEPTQELTANGAITIPSGLAHLNKAGVLAATLPAPQADGLVMTISADTAQAHTVTLAVGLNGGASVTGTFAGAIGDCVTLRSNGGYWRQAANINVTWS